MTGQDPHYQNKRMGQAMIAIAFALGIALLTWMFDGVQRGMRNPNADARSIVNAQGAMEVTLESNRQGHYMMSGRINGVPTEFMLDTGATDVVIPEAVARRAGLERGFRGQAMTANGVVGIYTTRIEELRLAGITLRDVRASINPSMDDSMVLLGMSALRQVEFVQQGNELTLRHYGN